MSSAPFEEAFGSDVDSGYASAADSKSSLPEVYFSPPQLKYINSQLQQQSTPDILKWCITTFPGLYQETALGLSGLVILDMLSKLDSPLKPQVSCIFIDTLHHFDETLQLLDRVRARYPNTKFHIYKPAGLSTAKEFSERYGKKLWEVDGESYDYHVKVEPSERAYAELNVKAAITGRRKTQGGKRGNMDVVEIDESGLVKINPLANWSFQQVNDYIRENNVPYNELLDLGYKSIGDWHSTQPVAEGEDERSGRWKGTGKTECGIHNPKSRYAAFLQEQRKTEFQKSFDAAYLKSMISSS